MTDALLAGHRQPLWNGKRELKAQIFPDQFPHWFGVDLATNGQAAGLLFPQVAPDTTPAPAEVCRPLTERDFMTGATEDRYPDVFELAAGVDGGGREESRQAVTALLTRLPQHTIVLGHDLGANGDFLATLLS
ncbi:hypothetical protein [Streptomyces johnsoniae]|uniref:Uncharacterized protein n=1 Tax=Streptomyces johnsoniae TaxID=3075532 RepID=A0ABU2RZ07_9ACTN|nr:hypothetical protein [Streptomyces sp. DSM 41886]MDT0441424.1 hypothetical protein [Streptomyces sp. DSM 41886]